ncbi:hypothetical protein [Yersinia enterocolitica]|uniref:hypothetical protein n=1 Tax=Yersinia enterocolitica TaxID=630 RepID=UPI00370719CF
MFKSKTDNQEPAKHLFLVIKSKDDFNAKEDLFDSGKKSLREGFESFSVNKSTTMQFGDANVCPACGK